MGFGSIFGGIADALTGGSGIGTIIGSAVDGFSSSSGAREVNRANAAQSQAQMDFQERMSNSAYQRAREDAEKAGFNPMISYIQGGASTPSGAQAQMQDTKTAGVNASRATALNQSTLQQQSAQTSNIKSQTSLNTDLAAKAKADTAKSVADAALAATSAKAVATSNRLKELEIPGAENMSKADQTWWGRNVKPWTPDILTHSAKSASSALFK